MNVVSGVEVKRTSRWPYSKAGTLLGDVTDSSEARLTDCYSVDLTDGSVLDILARVGGDPYNMCARVIGFTAYFTPSGRTHKNSTRVDGTVIPPLSLPGIDVVGLSHGEQARPTELNAEQEVAADMVKAAARTFGRQVLEIQTRAAQMGLVSGRFEVTLNPTDLLADFIAARASDSQVTSSCMV